MKNIFVDINMCYNFPQIICLLTAEKIINDWNRIENDQTPKYMEDFRTWHWWYVMFVGKGELRTNGREITC